MSFDVDFTLKELKSLRVKQRFSFRDQQYNGKYQIITFEEYILIALYANRVVGIYPEIKNPIFINQHTYSEITSNASLAFISKHVIGIGPSKDSIVPPKDNYLRPPTDLVVRAHALDLEVHPYTFRNENVFLHFDFHQDPYVEYEYWLHEIRVDGLFTDFTGSLHKYQEWTRPYRKEKKAEELLQEKTTLLKDNGY
ncbi:hypothetical protein PR202_gb11814 [Eleusine coracana subsp. coracana]|uniref:glycerophosphodiester phosphodiesterase n=1 Tax=Eleusine coracana subsp. coracana TaxID=191504 RepID=A0AAV5ENG6_ELECO|nr:hypothetical protein PR202_gb11814 [Eleusine coracana subsp. coracana]